LEDIGECPSKAVSLSDTANTFLDHLPVIDIENTGISAITDSIVMAVTNALEGKASAVVTNPIAKDVLYAAGFNHPGHTEYLGELTKHEQAPYAQGPVMMLSGGGLRVALETVHMPLIEAAKSISKESVINTATVMYGALQCDFGIKSPRISLSGLNPHAGENGNLGREEINIINPAAEALRDKGITVTNAQSADTLFHAEARQNYDAVLAMYHDQGLIPVKRLDFHGGVNITLGLPIVRTSPDHGTAFNIAGQGIARADSLIAAIKTAHTISNNRQAYIERHG